MEHPHTVESEPVEATCAFLTVQSAWLRRGLAALPGERVREVALAVHERGHERWLGILASASEPGCARDLEELYLVHGRVAEMLTRPVPGADADAVRRILADRVAGRTRAVVARLRSPRGWPLG